MCHGTVVDDDEEDLDGSWQELRAVATAVIIVEQILGLHCHEKLLDPKAARAAVDDILKFK